MRRSIGFKGSVSRSRHQTRVGRGVERPRIFVDAMKLLNEGFRINNVWIDIGVHHAKN